MRPAVLTVTCACACAVVALSGCGPDRPSGGPGSAAAANQAATVANPEAATATAQTEFGLLAGGDYGGAWDLWSQAAQQSISRTDFVALNTDCPQRGVPGQVVTTHPVGDGEVDIDWRRGARSGTARLLFTGGSWRYQPSESTMDSYRLGVDRLVAQLRAAHEC